jgi:hypothetical protein
MRVVLVENAGARKALLSGLVGKASRKALFKTIGELTAMNVPGRNTIVRMVMAFIDELCWAA